MATMDIKLRVPAEMKHDVEDLFRSMGLTVTGAVKEFMKQSLALGKIAPLVQDGYPRMSQAELEEYDRNLPVSENVPNAETIRSFEEYERGDYTRCSLEEFKRLLKLD